MLEDVEFYKYYSFIMQLRIYKENSYITQLGANAHSLPLLLCLIECRLIIPSSFGTQNNPSIHRSPSPSLITQLGDNAHSAPSSMLNCGPPLSAHRTINYCVDFSEPFLK